MKLITFHRHDGRVRTGVVLNQQVLDISDWIETLPVSAQALAHHQRAGTLPPVGGMLRWLSAGPDALPKLQDHVAWGAVPDVDLADVSLYAPVPRPGKIIGVGRNYADHAKETGVAPFEKPRIIFKMSSSVVAPGAPVVRPPGVTKLDFESELAVVIGAYGRHIPEAQALEHVAGYTVLNDVSAREFQFDISPAQTTFAKSMDGFCPIGPVLLTAEALPNPQDLEISTHVNGQRMQHASTRDMLFPVATLIAYVSQYMTLEPGDVLTTGTPAGIGAFRSPPVWLAAGDKVEVHIAPIGTLETHIG